MPSAPCARDALRQWITVLSPQAVAEMALLKAAGKGDFTTLEHLVNQGVDVDATDGVRATLVPSRIPACRVAPSALARPRPPSATATAFAGRRPIRPQPNHELTPPPSPPAATLATHAVVDPAAAHPACMVGL